MARSAARRKQGPAFEGPRPIALDSEMWSVDRLKPFARNARTHGAAQVKQLRASLRRYGFTMPILVSEDGTVIAGHGRLLAAQQEGMTHVPVMLATGWTEDQCQAYRIADNKLGENSEWDDDMLRAELQALQFKDVELDAVGFTDKELDKILASEAEKEAGGGRAPGKTQIQFNIVFDDELQQQAWFAFVKRLKTQFPAQDTLGARLSEFINGLGDGEG